MNWDAKRRFRTALEVVAQGITETPSPSEKAALEYQASKMSRTPWSGPGISVRTRPRLPTGARFRLALFIKTETTDLLARKGQTR